MGMQRPRELCCLAAVVLPFDNASWGPRVSTLQGLTALDASRKVRYYAQPLAQGERTICRQQPEWATVVAGHAVQQKSTC
jgi:hypothetical protein